MKESARVDFDHCISDPSALYPLESEGLGQPLTQECAFRKIGAHTEDR